MISALSISSTYQFFDEIKNTTSKLIRIDRPIVAFLEQPSKKTIAALIDYSIVPLTIVTATSVLGTAFGIYLLVANILLGSVLRMGIKENKEVIRKLPGINEYFSQSEILSKIALGLSAWFPTQLLVNIVGSLIEKLFLLLQIPLDGAQDVGLLLKSGGISGLVWMVFGCLIAPAAEEVLFRGCLQDLLKGKETPSSWNRFVAAVKTNAVFGAIHLSPFQGWCNLPIFAFTFFFGMAMSLLKEVTGDLWAPVTCHMTNNMISTFALRC